MVIAACSRQPRAVPAVAAALSLLLHLAVALAWAWPSLPDLPDEPPQAVAVEIVPAPRPAEPARARDAAPPPAPTAAKPIPQLDEPAPVTERSTPAAVSRRKLAPSRSERDMVLSQVVRHWRPPAALAAYADAEFAVTVTVLADGTLAGAFSARAPFDPAAAIDGYAGLDARDLRRQASESFYRALRQAQPLRLPPALAAKAPFDVVLEFRVRDVRKGARD